MYAQLNVKDTLQILENAIAHKEMLRDWSKSHEWHEGMIAGLQRAQTLITEAQKLIEAYPLPPKDELDAEYPYVVFIGNLSTMQGYEARGAVKGVDMKTHRHKTISETAKIKAYETGRFVGMDGSICILGDLRSNEDLWQIAEQKGLYL